MRIENSHPHVRRTTRRVQATRCVARPRLHPAAPCRATQGCTRAPRAASASRSLNADNSGRDDPRRQLPALHRRSPLLVAVIGQALLRPLPHGVVRNAVDGEQRGAASLRCPPGSEPLPFFCFSDVGQRRLRWPGWRPSAYERGGHHATCRSDVVLTVVGANPGGLPLAAQELAPAPIYSSVMRLADSQEPDEEDRGRNWSLLGAGLALLGVTFYLASQPVDCIMKGDVIKSNVVIFQNSIWRVEAAGHTPEVKDGGPCSELNLDWFITMDYFNRGRCHSTDSGYARDWYNYGEFRFDAYGATKGTLEAKQNPLQFGGIIGLAAVSAVMTGMGMWPSRTDGLRVSPTQGGFTLSKTISF